jgi:hypothetical protein
VTALGLALAWLVRWSFGGHGAGAMALGAAAAGGVALAAAISGTLRLVGRGADVRWLAGGVVAGTLLVWLR